MRVIDRSGLVVGVPVSDQGDARVDQLEAVEQRFHLGLVRDLIGMPLSLYAALPRSTRCGELSAVTVDSASALPDTSGAIRWSTMRRASWSSATYCRIAINVTATG